MKFIRIDNPTSIDRALIDNEIKSGNLVTVQFDDRPYDDGILAELNELCLLYDEHLCIRFFGHYGSFFDCNTLLKIPNVKGLHVNCLQSAKNVSVLTQLQHLKSVSIGVFELQETEILSADNFKNLTELTVTDTKAKNINLEYLAHYKQLKSLRLVGHTRNIEAVGELATLESLFLTSMKKIPLNFINRLKGLKNLSFMLGSRANIKEIERNNIENLEIVWVRGFNDLRNISNFPHLRTLKIEDEKHLPEISFDTIFPHLKELKLINCKTLQSVNGLKNLQQLDTLVISRTGVDFDNFIQQELPETLKILGFYTLKAKTDSTIKAILKAKGYGN